ncbi:MAG: type II toxin-antitoxin system RelE/ParE family toxin [Fidelibacterota bacterium]
MKFKLISPADQELIDIVNYYEKQEINLGNQFLAEFYETINLIGKYPKLWGKVGKKTHKAQLNRFPYTLLYIIEDKTILITCLAHQNRKPDHWISRAL